MKKEYWMPALWGMVAAVLGLAGPWCLVQAVDGGILAHDGLWLGIWVGLAALTHFGAGICRYIGRCRLSALGLGVEQARLKQLYRCLMGADIRDFPEAPQGRSMGQILLSAGSERRFIEALYSQGVPLLVTAAGSFLALFALSWPLACVSLLLCPAAGGLWLWMRQKIRPAARLDFERRENVYRRLVDSLRAMFSIRAFHREGQFFRTFDGAVEAGVEAGYALERRLGVQGPFFDIVQAAVVVLIFGIGGVQVMGGALSIGVLLGFQFYLGRLFGLVRTWTGLFGAWQHYLEGSARAADIERLREAPHVAFERARFPEVLRIEHLHFSFPGHCIWEDFSLCLCEGERRAILLPSGGGKTTLARCILGLYPPESGTIALPGGDSRCVGMVLQENMLFDGTLRDNVAMMCDRLDDGQFWDLMYLCCLEGVARRFGGMPVGDCGAKLSGGEQRRVMLARALAVFPKLLIIDQMASELEPELCREIFGRIRRAMPRMAILYLGHRAPEWD